ncbi:MAG: BamA/TamA family outer membrane protein, partial [Legionellales bacterium]|nr:BamA/TamA family outer membrane protein [Legionellales bacterium]
GGNSSIRGYDFQSKLIGTGKYVYLASLDMQIPIVWRWYLSIFYDIGNVFNDIKSPIKSSAGIGVMFKTPIGPVNLGYAKGLEKNAPKYRIFFSIGSEI